MKSNVPNYQPTHEQTAICTQYGAMPDAPKPHDKLGWSPGATAGASQCTVSGIPLPLTKNAGDH